MSDFSQSNLVIDKSIVAKIRKLLALADVNKNSHEHERTVAMQAALDLLAKHNLSIAEISKTTLDIQPEEIRGTFKMEPWIRGVLAATCKLYYTDYYLSGQRHFDGRIERFPVFIGTAENIAVTIDMATWLIKSIRQESNKMYREAHARKSFRLGAADRIFDRAQEITRAEKKSKVTAAGTSLMVIRNQFELANEKHLAKKNLRPFKARPIHLDFDAFSSGEAFGELVGLDRHVTNPTKRLSVND
jgi:hypothetical protein